MKKPKNRKRSFESDRILTRICQAVELDLTDTSLLQKCSHTVRVGIDTQLSELTKKYVPVGADTSHLQDDCFSLFHEMNDHMLNHNIGLRINTLGLLDRGIGHADLTDTDLALLKARSMCHQILGNFDIDVMFRQSKHSGGTTIGVPYANTSPERKLKFPISGTRDAITLFEAYRNHDVAYDRALLKINSGFLGQQYEEVRGSKATTVDKTSKKRRMICIEPTANMYLQQGLMSYITERFSAFTGFCLSTLPDSHQELARRGSIDGSLATIDFSSASDCVSVELLRWMLPAEWFSILHRVRSHESSFDGTWHALQMMSTMGNATTFPLETMVFWILGTVARTPRRSRSLFTKREDFKSVSVFGDDCILPTEDAESFMDLARFVGFIVNDDKSHYESTDPFRESCGGDFHLGYPVRAFHMSSPTSNSFSALEPWLYIVLNRLNEKYIQYFRNQDALYRTRLFELMVCLFQEYKLLFKLVPMDFPDDAGFKTLTVPPRMRLSKIKRTESGLASFSYCKYRYWEEKYNNPELRYTMWLKNPVVAPELRVILNDSLPAEVKFNPVLAPFKKYFIRERGGYVVARSSSFFYFT